MKKGMDHSWNDTDSGTTKYSYKILPQSHKSHTDWTRK